MDEPTDKIAKEDQESASTANEAFTITRQGEETITLDADRSATTTFRVKSTQPIRGRAELLIGTGEERQDSYEMPEGLQVDINGVREHEFRTEKDAKDYRVHLRVLGGKVTGGAKGTPAPQAESAEQAALPAEETAGTDAQGTPASQPEGEEQPGEGPEVETNPLQVTVDGARPGSYWICLDMVDVEDPDDMRLEGPRVEFKVPGRPFPWWIVAVAAVVLAVVAIGVVVLLRSWVDVPDVKGQPVADAQATIQAAGLIVTATMTIKDDMVARDSVLFTAPEAGTRVRRDSNVTMILSGGPHPVAVPNVVGLPEARAVEALMRVGFTMGSPLTVTDPIATPGWVVATTPEPGKERKRGSEVTLILSSGPERVEVPKVEGKTEEDAQKMLAAAGLVAVSSRIKSVEVTLDHVIDTNPEPGNSVPKGSTVELIVSAGPEAPNLLFYMTPRTGQGTLEVEYFDLSTGEGTRTWDFGDGKTSHNEEGKHLYTLDGTYTVTLTITNIVGQDFYLTKTDYITVEAISPVASFEFSGAALLSQDSKVTFTDTSEEEPTSWLWDFGDGAMSTAQSPVHQYQWAGTFPVTLKATNSAGSSEATRTVTIERPECLERVETDWVSEENLGPQTSCPDGMVAYGVRCSGDRCDNVSLICCRYHLGADDTAKRGNSDWTPEYKCSRSWSWSSFRNVTTCTPAVRLSEGGKWLKGLQCRGGFCSQLMLEYLWTDYLVPADGCHDGPTLSSAAPGEATCNPGEYVGGLTCDGPNCSHIRLWCCPAQ